jgi:hypothetical protein
LEYILENEDVRGKVEKLLLLLSVYGHIDLLRTQNHVCFLIFHAALHLSIGVSVELTIADIVLKEASFLYALMKTMFDKNKRNEEFFDWDDLNDLCWTPSFCQEFLGKDWQPSFRNAFRMEEFPNLLLMIEKKGDQVKQDQINKEKQKFQTKWKTYYDRAGGLLGMLHQLVLTCNRMERLHYTTI